jgi:NADPH:quinone reductase-like Zn-dependent oxidoreductase
VLIEERQVRDRRKLAAPILRGRPQRCREGNREVIAQLARWHQEGTLVFHEDIEDGLERAPAALASIYRGENRGKKLVRVADGARAL